MISMSFIVEERKLTNYGTSYYVLIPLEVSKEIKDEKVVVVTDLNSKAALIFPKSRSGKEVVSAFTDNELLKFFDINFQQVEIRKMKIGDVNE